MPKKTIPEHQKKRFEDIFLFIKNYRINDGLSQKMYSKLSDTHVNTIQRMETCKLNVTLLTLFNCVDAMEMTLSEFFQDIE
jgi:DNA-binding XRE family transcriptional regulator